MNTIRHSNNHLRSFCALLLLSSLGLLAACGKSSLPATPYQADEFRTTDGKNSVVNLNAAIESLNTRLQRQPDSYPLLQSLVHHLLLRADVLGSASDLLTAHELAQRAVSVQPENPAALTLRAATLASRHQFQQAVADIAAAKKMAPGDDLAAEELSLSVAMGRDVSAEKPLAARPEDTDFRTAALLAQYAAEHGRYRQAQRWFRHAQQQYRDVSPIPLAWLYATEGRIEMQRENWQRARELFGAAAERLPDYALAQGHLAEIEAELGDPQSAMRRLRPLAEISEDPDYAFQLGRLMQNNGQTEAGEKWLNVAQQRYEKLLQTLPDAYADHGTELWLYRGEDLPMAASLAARNLSNRKTLRARSLALDVAERMGAEGCPLVKAVADVDETEYVAANKSLQERVDTLSGRCQ